MVLVIFTYDVDPAKKQEYLKATAEKIKPFWESQGCQSYDVWELEEGNTFLKLMYFKDMEAKNKTIGMKGEEADKIRELWRSFVTDFTSLKTYIQRI
jgi:quinol monooxygenase YgiN